MISVECPCISLCLLCDSLRNNSPGCNRCGPLSSQPSLVGDSSANLGFRVFSMTTGSVASYTGMRNLFLNIWSSLSFCRTVPTRSIRHFSGIFAVSKFLRKSDNSRKKHWRGQPKSTVTCDRRIECVGTVYPYSHPTKADIKGYLSTSVFFNI
jgi:hypothetical protein